MAKQDNHKTEDPNRKIMELQMLDQQLRQLEEQMGMIEQQIMEQESMIVSLESLKGKKGSETMIPLGPGLFVHGKIEETDKVFIHVGNKIIASKKTEEAVKIMEKRRDKTLEAASKLNSEMQKILERMTSLESQINMNQKHSHSCSSCSDDSCSSCH